MIRLLEQFQRRRSRARLTTGTSNGSSANSSRVPCRNSIGTRRPPDASPGRPTAFRPDAAESRRTPDRGRRAAARWPAPATSCAPPNDLPPANNGSPGLPPRPPHRRAHRGLRERRRDPAACRASHVGKLIAQRRDAAVPTVATAPGMGGSSPRRRHGPGHSIPAPPAGRSSRAETASGAIDLQLQFPRWLMVFIAHDP